MSTPTELLVAEAGLPPEHAADLEAVMSALRELVPDEAPTPSVALAALMAAPPQPAAPRSRRRLVAVGSAAALLSSLTVTGVAAAANELPEAAQRVVAELSERYLPFHFPQPRNRATQVEDDPAPERVAPTDLATGGATEDPTAPSEGSGASPDVPTPSADPSARASDEAVAPTAGPTGPAPSDAPTADPSGGTDATAEPDPGLAEGESRVGSDPTAEPTAPPTSSPAGDATAEQPQAQSDDTTGGSTDAGTVPPPSGTAAPSTG